jgi:ribosomal protein S18 acetylase RimI-like enzyme
VKVVARRHINFIPHSSFQIMSVRTTAELYAVVALFRDYAESLAIDLGFQDFATELATLPGKYAPPKGDLLIARHVSGEYLGCIGLRPLVVGDICEVKRLYVSPEGRGLGIGRALVAAILATGRHIGYHEMRLDTLPGMVEAIALYRKSGFRPIPHYYETPLEGTMFLGRSLDADA